MSWFCLHLPFPFTLRAKPESQDLSERLQAEGTELTWETGLSCLLSNLSRSIYELKPTSVHCLTHLHITMSHIFHKLMQDACCFDHICQPFLQLVMNWKGRQPSFSFLNGLSHIFLLLCSKIMVLNCQQTSSIVFLQIWIFLQFPSEKTKRP